MYSINKHANFLLMERAKGTGNGWPDSFLHGTYNYGSDLAHKPLAHMWGERGIEMDSLEFVMQLRV